MDGEGGGISFHGRNTRSARTIDKFQRKLRIKMEPAKGTLESRRVFAFAADSASEYRSQLHSEISERTNDNCRMNRPSELPQVRWPAVDESKLPMNSHGRASIRTRNC